MVQKYARVKDIIVPVRYIDSHSFPRASFSEKTVHILEQINVRRQITVTFSRQMAIVCIYGGCGCFGFRIDVLTRN